MPAIRIEVSSRYKKSFCKLSPAIQKKAIGKIRAFEKDPFALSLKSHNLSGREKDCWAFWVDYHFRIKFIFLNNKNNKEVLFLDIGTHNIYK